MRNGTFPRYKPVILAALLTLGGGALRVWQIGHKGLWLDEAFSVWLGWRTLPDMLGWVVRIDQHPPLYYTLLHYWLALGDSAATARLLSALAGTLTIPLLYLWARRLGGVRVGLLAALILALSPFHVRFAQETRMYTLLTFNAAAALLALIYLLTADPTPGPSPQRRGGCAAWAVYVVAQTATMLTHNTALLFPVAVNLFVGGLIVRRKFLPAASDAAPVGAHVGGFYAPPLRAPPLRAWLLAQAASLLLWLPWLPAFVVQARGVYAAFWLAPPTWLTVTGTVAAFLSEMLPRRMPWLDAAMAGFVLLAVIGAAALRRRRSAALALLLVLFVTPIAGEWLVSLRRPIFYDRTLIWASLPLYVLLAVGLAQLRRPYALAGLALIVAANGASLAEYYTHYEKEQWREAAAYVAQHIQPGDKLLFNATWVQIPFDYYYRAANRPVPEYGAPVNLFDRGELEPKMTPADLPRLRELLRGGGRVWLIYSHNWYTDPQGLIPLTLAEDRREVNRRRFNGLEVRLYAAP